MIRNSKRTMRGMGLTGFFAIVALCAFGYFMFFYDGKSVAEKNAVTPTAAVATKVAATPAVTAIPGDNAKPAKAETNTAAVVAGSAAVGAVVGAAVVSTAPAWYMGGWLLAEGLGFGMMLLLGLPFLILFGAIGVFSDWGDPHFNWKKREQDPEAESREYLTTALFAGMMLTLNWAGVPIWSTVTSLWGPNWAQAWLYTALVIPYVGIGIWWCSHRWDDLTQYLNHKRKVRYQQACDNIRGKLEQIKSLKEAIDKSQPEGKNRAKFVGQRQNLIIDVRMNLMGQELRQKPNAQQIVHGDRRVEQHEIYEAKDFTDTELDRWISELQPVEGKEFKYPPEFKGQFVKEGEKPFSAAWQDHGGQMYLWIAFWPMSMSIRVIHKIVTLEVLKTIFMMIVKSLGRWWDNIAKRNEITISAIERDVAPPATPATAVTPDGGDGGGENILTIPVRARNTGTEG